MAKTKVNEAAEAVETTDEAAEVLADEVIQESNCEEIKQTIYIGPSMRGVMTGTVFIGSDWPKHLEAAIEQQPVIKELIVPVSQLAEARKQLQDRNSAMSKYYMKAKAKGE